MHWNFFAHKGIYRKPGGLDWFLKLSCLDEGIHLCYCSYYQLFGQLTFEAFQYRWSPWPLISSWSHMWPLLMLVCVFSSFFPRSRLQLALLIFNLNAASISCLRLRLPLGIWIICLCLIVLLKNKQLTMCRAASPMNSKTEETACQKE